MSEEHKLPGRLGSWFTGPVAAERAALDSDPAEVGRVFESLSASLDLEPALARSMRRARNVDELARHLVGPPPGDEAWARADPSRAHWGRWVAFDRFTTHASGGAGLACLWGVDDDPALDPRPLSWFTTAEVVAKSTQIAVLLRQATSLSGGTPAEARVCGAIAIELAASEPSGLEALGALVVGAYGGHGPTLFHRQIAAWAIATSGEAAAPRRDRASPSPESVEALAVEVAAFFRGLGEAADPSGDWRALRFRLEDPARLRSAYLEALGRLGAEGQGSRNEPSLTGPSWLVAVYPPAPGIAASSGLFSPAAMLAARCLWLDRVAPRLEREGMAPAAPVAIVHALSVLAHRPSHGPRRWGVEASGGIGKLVLDGRESSLYLSAPCFEVPAGQLDSKAVDALLKPIDSLAFMHLWAWLGSRQHRQFALTGDSRLASRIEFDGGLAELAVEIGTAPRGTDPRRVNQSTTAALRLACDLGKVFGWADGAGSSDSVAFWRAEILAGKGRRKPQAIFTLGSAMGIRASSNAHVPEKRLLAPYADPRRAPKPRGNPRAYARQLVADQYMLVRGVTEWKGGEVVHVNGAERWAWPFSERKDLGRFAEAVGLSEKARLTWWQRVTEGDHGTTLPMDLDGLGPAGGPLLVDLGEGYVCLGDGWDRESDLLKRQGRYRQKRSRDGKKAHGKPKRERRRRS